MSSTCFERLWQDAHSREHRIVAEAGRLAAAGHAETPVALFRLARGFVAAGDRMRTRVESTSDTRGRARREIARFLEMARRHG